jgi:hypothetical protein
MPWPAWHSGAKRQLGETQMKVLARAVASPSGQLIIGSRDNAAWCAIKRLTQRGLFDRLTFGNDVIGRMTIYQITDYGRERFAEEQRIRS